MSGRGGAGLPREARIRRAAEVTELRLRGRRADSSGLTLYLRRASEGPPSASRFAVSAPKRIGGAADRNRVKRLLREAWRRSRAGLPARMDVLCVAKAGVTRFSGLDVALRSLQDALRRGLSAGDAAKG